MKILFVDEFFFFFLNKPLKHHFQHSYIFLHLPMPLKGAGAASQSYSYEKLKEVEKECPNWRRL